VRGSDPDGDSLTYAITGGNPDGLFDIGSDGKIILVKDLSTATQPFYDLVIRVTDPGGLQASGTVRLIIHDTSVGLTGDTEGIEGTTDIIRFKFVRVSSDNTAPLMVFFTKTLYQNQLSKADFADTPGRADIFDGTSIVIPANASEYIIELTPIVNNDTFPLERLALTVKPGNDYAVAGSNADPPDPNESSNALDLHRWVYLRVYDKVQPFANGTPSASDGNKAHRNDVVQGVIGDCNLMAAMAALADKGSAFLQSPSMIRDNDQSTNPLDYLVRLFNGEGIPFDVPVNFALTRGHDAADPSGDYDANGVEIWPQLLEQAYAQSKGGYASIDNGEHVDLVWTALTGRNAWRHDVRASTDAQIAQIISEAVQADKVVILGTKPGAPWLVGNHAYYVRQDSSDAAGIVTKLFLYNPWARHPEVQGLDGDQETIVVAQFSANLSWVYVGDRP
jgi:hypothetical protein